MSDALAALPEPDRLEGLPHPRETARIFGHDEAEAQLLAGLNSGRLHHSWLLTGPRGIGKASLAWRFARAALADEGGDALFGPQPIESLEVDPEHPVARRMLAGSEPRLLSIKRSWNTEKRDPKDWRLRSQIVVDDVRKLRDFFGMRATDGGRRVVIVDAADDMNVSAANAILKLMEEPPNGALLLLVAHRPGALLPTIRSRCRVLRMQPLGAEELRLAMEQALGEPIAPEQAQALVELAGGSVADALTLVQAGGLELYGELVSIVSQLPRLERSRMLKLADRLGARGADAELGRATDLFETLLSRLARSAARRSLLPEAAPGEAALCEKFASHPSSARLWSELAADLPQRLRKGRAVNLDPAGLVVDMFLRLERGARDWA